MIMYIKMVGPWKPVYNNVRALVTFFLGYVSIDWREEFYIQCTVEQ